MNEQELKVVLQGAIDGKVIQARKDNLVSSWTDVEQRDIVSMFKFIVPNLFGYEFRVKPDMKVFKYKTRPYEVVYHDKVVALGIWSSTIHTGTEQTFQNAFSVSDFYKSFRWLAHVTNHEVVYE